MPSSWNTKFTKRFPCQLPIVGAPMAGTSGGLLAAETCRAGALGFIAAGHTTSLDEIDRQVTIFRDKAPADASLAVGFIGHSTFSNPDSWDRFERVLKKHQPKVVQFFAPAIAIRCSDGKTNVNVAHDYQCQVLAQVGNVAEGLQALEAGVDGLIAQGSEAGGHGLRPGLGKGTLALAARLVTLTKDTPVPVLAAGGIVDGRGVSAALALGCGGAVLGTRLWASKEALGHASFKELLASPFNGPDQVVRSTVIDHIANSYSSTPWPVPYDSVGMLENETSKEWESRRTDLEVALFSESAVASKYKKAVAEGDPQIAQVYSGQGVGDIHSIDPAYDVIVRINEEAISIVRSMPQLLD